MKVVKNVCFGGFGLSKKAIERYNEIATVKIATKYGIRDRTDPVLIQVVEELGAAANGPFSELEIVEIPDDVKWEIEEYDGCETIVEAHRTW